MRILVQNLGDLPYALDLGEFDDGMVRPRLQPYGCADDTTDIGARVDPWTLNTDGAIAGMRQLVVPRGSLRIITQVPGGYRVTATPRGQLSVTFLEDPDDLVFLFFGGSSGTGLTADEHERLRQLIHFVDEGPAHGFASGMTKVVTGGLFPTDITWWSADPGMFPGAVRIVRKTIDRSTGGATSVKPTPITWTIYATDGTTVLQSLQDDVVYSGIAELKRIRTIF